MPDPFVDAHQIDALELTLGGVVPVSIRDQMLRGRVLVERIHELGLIGDGRRLLVVGAGAGGATAAVVAADLGVDVVLVDAAPLAFSRQAGCNTRWVDPVHYDWPVLAWGAGSWPPTVTPRFPWPSRPFPFSFGANDAASLAATWQAELVAHVIRLAGRLSSLMGTTARAFQERDGFVDCELVSGNGGITPARFGLVLHTGPGTERSYVGDGDRRFWSVPFWSPDRLGSDDFGLGIRPRILISGSGDGALQDFLRVTTGIRGVRDLVSEIAGVAPETAAMVVTVVGRLTHSNEDQGSRLWQWGPGPRHGGGPGRWDHSLHSGLHRAAANALAELRQNAADWPAAMAMLRARCTRRVFAEVVLLLSCAHLTPFYAFNRFVTLLLLDAFLPDRRVRAVRAAALESVECLGPSPLSAAGRHVVAVSARPWDSCHGLPHRVSVRGSDCARGAWGPIAPLGTFDIIVIRHGIERRHAARGDAVNVPVQSPWGARARQLLPYVVP